MTSIQEALIDYSTLYNGNSANIFYDIAISNRTVEWNCVRFLCEFVQIYILSVGLKVNRMNSYRFKCIMTLHYALTDWELNWTFVELILKYANLTKNLSLIKYFEYVFKCCFFVVDVMNGHSMLPMVNGINLTGISE